MVFVSFLDEFPWHLDDHTVLVPFDVGCWAVISGGRPDLRRRVAADLRALSYHLAVPQRPQLHTLDAA